MSEFKSELEWNRNGKTFDFERYDRTHRIQFGSGTTVTASAAPDFQGNPDAVNPEEQLVAAVSSCHMLTFLAIAARSHLVVERYTDTAVGVLAKNEAGKLAITEITLKPVIAFSGETSPDTLKLKQLHEKAHANCFIANSIRTRVIIL